MPGAPCAGQKTMPNSWWRNPTAYTRNDRAYPGASRFEAASSRALRKGDRNEKGLSDGVSDLVQRMRASALSR
jgi:hypothetical protein